MQIAILLYDGMTALDAVGPAQVLAGLPGTRLAWVAQAPGAMRTDCGVSLVADHSLDEVLRPDVVLVPGGVDVRPVMRDERTLGWLRTVHATSQWTTSVCTGALVLAAGGLLRGLRATTHWAVRDRLRDFGAEPVDERIVREGKVITAAGVSAGIDMALRLVELIAGERAAQIVQLLIEYDPAPPFQAGSPRTAPAEVVTAARQLLGAAD